MLAGVPATILYHIHISQGMCEETAPMVILLVRKKICDKLRNHKRAIQT